MKRIVACLLLLALEIALLSGCAGKIPAAEPGADSVESVSGPPEAPLDLSPATQAAPTPENGAPDWSEPDAIDDRFSFRFSQAEGCGCYTSYEHLVREELPAYVARWVDGGEILDSQFWGAEGCLYGWVCFSGSPKTELGWRSTQLDGRDCFCRALCFQTLREEGESEYGMSERSFAMEPVHMPEGYSRYDDSGEVYLVEQTLPELASAELYVPALGQSYRMTDPTELESLRRALSQPENEALRTSPIPARSAVKGNFAPLYLHYADGSSSLAVAAGDGADCCQVWGGFDQGLGARSIFERFGVPIATPGRTHLADGSTLLETSLESRDSDLALTARHDYRYTYDAAERLVRYEHSFWREDLDFNEQEERLYSYREDEKLERIDIHWESAESGGHDEEIVFSYDAEGKLTRMERNDKHDAARGMYYEYRYDELGRLAAIIYHYRDGREGLPGGNSYFWYDEQGRRRVYGVNEQGELIGGPSGEDGEAPVRR